VNVGLADLPLQHRLLKPELDAAIEQVFSSAGFILGENVAALESDIAQMCGAKYGTGVNSGTDALLLSLAAIGIGAGDEVITTAFTFVATAETIRLLGAVPVFVDIDINTFNLDANLVEAKITPKTKAILPVHLFGQMADLTTLRAIANRHNLKIVGDGAQAIGCLQNGQPLAAIGEATTLSFYPTKNLGACGDAGMVLTNDEHIFEELKLLRFHGSGGGYFYKKVGYCSRLDALQAAILRVKVRYLDGWNEARRRNAALYNECLSVLADKIHLPQTMDGNHHVYHQYTIRVENGGERRAPLQKHLAEKGVGSAVFYPLSLHLQEAYADLGYSSGDLPISERVTSEVLSLPVHPQLTHEQVQLVVDSLLSFFAR
jgi:dTDP-4-amino-4,6-dideoxygalactose transaminase